MPCQKSTQKLENRSLHVHVQKLINSLVQNSIKIIHIFKLELRERKVFNIIISCLKMDDLDDLIGAGSESVIYDKGYHEGFETGCEEGKQDGWTTGLKTGADIGFELGRYKGFAIAAQKSLTSEPSPSSGESTTDKVDMTKSLKICEKIIKLVDEFDVENVTSLHDACSTIRTQYNLLKASLGVMESGSQKETLVGQKYSF